MQIPMNVCSEKKAGLNLKEEIINMYFTIWSRQFRLERHGGERAYNQRAERILTDIYYTLAVNHADWWYGTVEVERKFETVEEAREYITNFLDRKY